MKSLIFRVTIVLCSSVFSANAYELIQFENQEYRDYSKLELISLIKNDAQYLGSFRCDQKQEFSVFTQQLQENNAENSFHIKNNLGQNFTYHRGRLFNEYDAEVIVDSNTIEDPFVLKAMDALAKLEKTPSGERVLRQLEKSRYPLFLVKGYSRFDAREENGRPSFGLQQAQALSFFVTLRKPDNPMPFGQIGSGGYIQWNPISENLCLESDDVLRSAPEFIALGHELYHAYDAVRGLLDTRFVKGERYEYAAVAEYRGVFFENQLRKESLLKFRKAYSETSDFGTLLDTEGNPIKIPSACLKGDFVSI